MANNIPKATAPTLPKTNRARRRDLTEGPRTPKGPEDQLRQWAHEHKLFDVLTIEQATAVLDEALQAQIKRNTMHGYSREGNVAVSLFTEIRSAAWDAMDAVGSHIGTHQLAAFIRQGIALYVIALRNEVGLGTRPETLDSVVAGIGREGVSVTELAITVDKAHAREIAALRESERNRVAAIRSAQEAKIGRSKFDGHIGLVVSEQLRAQIDTLVEEYGKEIEIRTRAEFVRQAMGFYISFLETRFNSGKPFPEAMRR